MRELRHSATDSCISTVEDIDKWVNPISRTYKNVFHQLIALDPRRRSSDINWLLDDASVVCIPVFNADFAFYTGEREPYIIMVDQCSIPVNYKAFSIPL